MDSSGFSIEKVQLIKSKLDRATNLKCQCSQGILNFGLCFSLTKTELRHSVETDRAWLSFGFNDESKDFNSYLSPTIFVWIYNTKLFKHIFYLFKSVAWYLFIFTDPYKLGPFFY